MRRGFERGLNCSAAAALEFNFGLVDLDSVLESDAEIRHNTASRLIVGIGDQASGRVDVPGGVQQLASTSSQVIGKVHGQVETEHEVHQTNCDIGKVPRSRSWSNNSVVNTWRSRCIVTGWLLI